MQLDYVLRRIRHVPAHRLAGGDRQLLPAPARRAEIRSAQKLVQQAALGGNVQAGMEDMVSEYNEKFGLDTPTLAAISELSVRYGPLRLQLFDRQLSGNGHRHHRRGAALDDRAADRRRPSFRVIGNLLGAFMAWPRAPKFLQFVMPPLLSLSADPVLLLGLILVYIFAFRFAHASRSFGGYTAGTIPGHAPRHFSWTCSATPCCRRSRSFWSRSAAGRSACAR